MKPRLYVAGVLGGLAVLAVGALVIFRFGRFDPSPPELEDHPNPSIPGELLYTNRDGCIIRAAASGATREEVYCQGQPTGGQVTWIDSDTIGFVAFEQRGPILHEVDLATREVRDTGRTVQPDKGRPFPGGTASKDGEEVSTDEDGRVFLIKDGVRTEIADFDVPEYGGPQPMLWSPDGEWILLQYHGPNAGGPELWILSRDGRTKGTIATDAQGFGASWRIDGVGITPELTDITVPARP